MITITAPQLSYWNMIWSDLWQEHKPLMLTGVLMMIALGVSIVGVFLDPRVITGAPAWLKPAKFSISIAIYSFTFVWMLTFVKGYPKTKNRLAWITTIMFWIEWIAITIQMLRGTTSHFNFSTVFDGFIFGIMGFAIMVLWFASFGLAFLLLRQKIEDRAMAWALRLGVLGAIIGMAMAFAMPSPTPEQLENLQSGVGSSIIGAHAVGVEDGGAGLPIVGWSTEGGDYRVSHFIGLHAMQVLPLLAMALAFFTQFSEKRRIGLVISGAVAYIGITLLTFWQAIRGQSIIAPDSLTLTAFALIVAVTLVGTIFSMTRYSNANA